MDDKDHVFARFKDNRPASADRREVMSVPRRAGASGSRTVQVVHARLGAAVTAKPNTRRPGPADDAAPFAAQRPASLPAAVEPEVVEAPPPVIHVMPAYAPSVLPAEIAPPATADAPDPVAARPRRPPEPGRRSADPFDPADEGANCLRCGYAVEEAREKRGLSTCAECG